MSKLTLYIGLVLIILGIAGYLITGMQSITALIPTLFGVIIYILGTLAKKEHLHKHMIHAALLVTLVGLFGSFSGILSTIDLLMYIPVERPGAAIARALMAVICLLYLAAGIYSFIQARRKPLNS